MPASPVALLGSLLRSSPGETPDFSILADQSAWDAIEEHAPRYGVAPLVAYAVRSHISGSARAWCDEVLVQSWTRHQRMLGHLEFVHNLLSDARVPAVSLKGPLLAQRYYTPAFLRKPSMDLDFAVGKENLSHASDTLIKAGFTLLIPVDEALERSHHLEFTHPSRPKVEVHFRLSHMSLGLPVEEFIERAVPIGNIRVLAPDDQLVHLIVHLAHSRFGTLFHRYEIHRIAKQEPASVVADACRQLIANGYCGVLRMADIARRVEWGEPLLPPGVDVPRTWLNSRLDERLFRQLDHWSTPGRLLNAPARLQGRWLDIQVSDSPKDALRLLRHLGRSARFGNARRFWMRPKDLVYVGTGAAR
jgi:hypothetical protein